MFTERSLRKNPAVVKAFTGLPAEEFWSLVEEIETLWPDYERQRQERPERQRAVGGGRPYAQSLVVRVALVLTYLRLHAPQQAVALMFGASQAEVSRELRRLLPVIVQVLPHVEVWEVIEPAATEGLAEGKAAEAAIEGIEMSRLADGRVLVDATEQEVYRSQDNEVRKQYYSGKQKAFTLKTPFVTDGEHPIVAISQAVPGAMHDKKLSDALQTLAHLPNGCEVDADQGYQGLAAGVERVTVRKVDTHEEQQVPRLKVNLPFKKPQGGELTEEQRAFNRWLGAIRVRVEHCLGWVKNGAIMATRFRCAHTIYTRVMRVVCGLVNRQTARWQAAQAPAMA